MAATVNLATWSDEDFLQQFVLHTKGDAATPINLTGSTFAMKARRSAGDSTAWLDLSSAAGDIQIDDAAAGKFTVKISNAKLSKLPPGEYVHSLIRTTGGLKMTVWRGTLTHALGPSR